MPFPTFRGKFNSLKARVWVFLSRYDRYFTAQEIADATGVDVWSLRTALIKWCCPEWHRVLRRKRDNSDIYEYRLSAKGRQWVCEYSLLIPIQYKVFLNLKTHAMPKTLDMAQQR